MNQKIKIAIFVSGAAVSLCPASFRQLLAPQITFYTGAFVIVKGTSNGTATDFDREYTLNNVPDGATLVFQLPRLRITEIICHRTS
jgi:hypothetical protein